MPSTKKKSKNLVVKTETISPKKESAKSPKKLKVVSSQLQKSIKNKEKQRKLQNHGKPNRGILYIKHLPHGFFEEQLQKYFGQFGTVTRVRLARSLRTGRSRGYAFVEFAVPEVAEVAAETMNNYLMFRKIIKTAYIPPDQIKFNYFKTSLRKVTNKFGKEVFVSTKTREANKKMNELNNWSEENCKKRMKRARAKLRKMKREFGDYVDSCVYDPGDLEQPDAEKEQENTAGASAPVDKKKKVKQSISQASSDSNGLVKKRKIKKSTSQASSDSNALVQKRKIKKGATQGSPESNGLVLKKRKTKKSTSQESADSNGLVAKKRKTKKSTSQESADSSMPSSEVASSSRKKSSSSSSSTPAKKTRKPEKKIAKSAASDTSLGRLLSSTFEDDSSDDDFIPGDNYDSSDDIPGDIYDSTASESENSDQPALQPYNGKQKQTIAQKRPRRQVAQAMNDTIEDAASSNSELEFESETTSMSDAFEASSDEEQEMSPVKPVANVMKKGQNKLDRIIHKKPLAGGIRKKGKDTKPAKSSAIKEKLKETAKEMAKQEKVAHMLAKALTKQEKVLQMKGKNTKKKDKKRGH